MDDDGKEFIRFQWYWINQVLTETNVGTATKYVYMNTFLNLFSSFLYMSCSSRTNLANMDLVSDVDVSRYQDRNLKEHGLELETRPQL